MPRRIILSFRGAQPSTPAHGARYIAQALTVKKRAEAHGATLCAWSALSFAFSFDPDDLEEAVRLASMVLADAGAGLRAGLAAGDLAPIGERNALSGLGWGMPLVRANALSRAAGPGEVIVDDALLADRGDEIVSFGFRIEGETQRRLVAVVPPPVEPEPVPEPEPERATLPDAPSSLRNGPASRGPASARVSDPHIETAKRALLQGDTAALERLIAELRESGEHADLVERMSGFVALRRGATADALRRLRAASEAAKEPSQRARARLAYGVALAGAGRTESALLEALTALARAREAGDTHGEHACSLFLARLSSAAGHADAASVWAMIAAKAEAAQSG